MCRIKDNSLYLVLTEDCASGRAAAGVARQAIAGGIDVLQMREKAKSRPELFKLGKELASICNKSGVIFIVNDDPGLAMEVGADGVHLGQEDLEIYDPARVRRLVGPDNIIGVSTHSLAQFKKANEGDFDYIAFGPIFPTKTKDYFIGDNDIGKVIDIARKPVVFIGGINTGNVDGLLEKGARNIALMRAISESGDVRAAAAAFKEKLNMVGQVFPPGVEQRAGSRPCDF